MDPVGEKSLDSVRRSNERGTVAAKATVQAIVYRLYLVGDTSSRKINTPAEFAQSTNPRRDAVLRSRNGSAPQPAATAPNTATPNR